MTERWKRSNPARVAVIIGVIFVWGGILLVRLFHLQVLRHETYVQLAMKGQQITRSVLAPRGVIYDAHMDELATSIAVSTVVAEPHRIEDPAAAAVSLAAILKMDAGELKSRMTDPARSTFMVVKRRIDPNDEGRIEALGIPGVYLIEESMRVYPNRDLACHTLGFVNLNGDAGTGVEAEYDELLRGKHGKYSLDVDARRRSFRAQVEEAPTQGHSLVLSIDRSIQYIAERELAEGVLKARAAAGVAVVMESDTGRILALAGYPNFNCNTFNEYGPEFWRNRTISDFFEPGSTFKVVVAAAALEAGLTTKEDRLDCQMGIMKVAGHIFHDHKPYGLLTFGEILEYSSNIGAAKLGLRLGERRLYDALREFGFGAKTGIDLPGEIVGLVRPWQQWSGLSVPAISFGQEVGVTSMQILTAINVIANGGFHVRPSVVDRVIDPRGELVQAREPERRLTLSPETAAAVRDAFEGVVLRGTGQQAALEGYRAAGKTGTAQKIVNGRYSNSKYVASFIGFAPLPRPRITVLVQIDEPKGSIYGGDVSAPIFRRITQETLLQLHVPPDQPSPDLLRRAVPAQASASEDFLPNATPVLPLAEPAAAGDGVNPDGSITVLLASDSIEVPDFAGMSKRAVVERCQELGLKVQTFGSGTAILQLPPAGALIAKGGACSVTFAHSQMLAARAGLGSGKDRPR